MAQTKAFNGQRDGEELLFVFRRHIIAMRKGFYMLLVPLAVGAIPPLIWQDTLELFLLPVVGLGLGLVGFCYHFLLWRDQPAYPPSDAKRIFWYRCSGAELGKNPKYQL